MTLNRQRVIDDLKALRTMTGNAHGAQRLAWSEPWLAGRAWLRERAAEVPGVTCEQDEAGNLWFSLPGRSRKSVLIGGHMDSVPNGGWLDGCLNVLAGLEVLRRLAAQGRPALTVKLVDWADEEGARFGPSCFGSGSLSGAMKPAQRAELRDSGGERLRDVLARCGVDVDRAPRARKRLRDALAYLELHIEQGPVLEALGLPMGVVTGTFGVERHSVTFTGQAAHSGSTPMKVRRDALIGASRFQLAVRDIAIQHGGVGTVGRVDAQPGIVTAVAGEATCLLDQRHLSARKLTAMNRAARTVSARIAREEGLGVVWRTLWQTPPMPFDPELIRLGDAAVKSVCATSMRLPSGPLHDATEMARAGLPTVMLFVQSLRGISHAPIEDTDEAHLRLSVAALDELVTRVMAKLG